MTRRRRFTKREMRQLCREADMQQQRLRGGRFWRQLDFAISLALVFVLALGFRQFLAEPIRVDGDSMVPTLIDGEHMFVEKISYWLAPPARGDIIICYYPGYTETCVKRVIATAGETVEIRSGTVYVDGRAIDETAYWRGELYGSYGPATVPPRCVFVMGDNRNASKDSRSAAVGAIPQNKIVGRVRAVFFPLHVARGF